MSEDNSVFFYMSCDWVNREKEVDYFLGLFDKSKSMAVGFAFYYKDTKDGYKASRLLVAANSKKVLETFVSIINNGLTTIDWRDEEKDILTQHPWLIDPRINDPVIYAAWLDGLNTRTYINKGIDNH